MSSWCLANKIWSIGQNQPQKHGQNHTIQQIDCNILFANFKMSTRYFCWSGWVDPSFLGIFVYGPLQSFVVNGEFKQQDGRKKRRAKHLSTPWIPDPRSVLDYSLCQWNLDTWFHSVVRFRFVELFSGFQKQQFPEFLNPDSVTLDDDTAIEHSRKWITNWKPCRLKFYSFRALKNEMCFAIQSALRYVINVNVKCQWRGFGRIKSSHLPWAKTIFQAKSTWTPIRYSLSTTLIYFINENKSFLNF